MRRWPGVNGQKEDFNQQRLAVASISTREVRVGHRADNMASTFDNVPKFPGHTTNPQSLITRVACFKHNAILACAKPSTPTHPPKPDSTP